jgi:hypothetical protein
MAQSSFHDLVIYQDDDGYHIKLDDDNDDYSQQNISEDDNHNYSLILPEDCIDLYELSKNWHNLTDNEKISFFLNIDLKKVFIQGVHLQEINDKYQKEVKALSVEYQKMEKKYYSTKMENGQTVKQIIIPFNYECDKDSSIYINFGLFYNIKQGYMEDVVSLYGLPFDDDEKSKVLLESLEIYSPGTSRALEDAKRYKQMKNSKDHLPIMGNEVIVYRAIIN